VTKGLTKQKRFACHPADLEGVALISLKLANSKVQNKKVHMPAMLRCIANLVFTVVSSNRLTCMMHTDHEARKMQHMHEAEVRGSEGLWAAVAVSN
jgi:hypothetical protein